MDKKELSTRLDRVEKTLQDYFGSIPVEATSPEVLSEIDNISNELWQLRKEVERMQGVQNLPTLEEEPVPQPIDIAAAAVETIGRRAKTYLNVDNEEVPVQRRDSYIFGTSPIREALQKIRFGSDDENNFTHPYIHEPEKGKFHLSVDRDEKAKIEIQKLMAAAGDSPQNEWYTSDTLTEFDYIIQEVVANLYMQGYRFQSPEQIYTCRFGRDNHGVAISEADRRAICDSIKRLCSTTVRCNFCEYARAMQVKGFESKNVKEYYSISGPVLHADEVFRTVDFEGKKISVLSGWNISCIPTIFVHCIKLQKTKKVDRKALQICGNRISELKIAVHDYLLKRLGYMEANADISDKILWTTMETQPDINIGDDRKKRKRMKEYATQQLDEWKANKIIKDWREESGEAAGVILTPNYRKKSKKQHKPKKTR